MDSNTQTATSNELTYTKQMFQSSSNKTELLGVPWNNLTDKLSISIAKFQQAVTKRNMLSYVASIYDLLGIISPCYVLGIVLYSELCNEKIRWDSEALSILETNL